MEDNGKETFLPKLRKPYACKICKRKWWFFLLVKKKFDDFSSQFRESHQYKISTKKLYMVLFMLTRTHKKTKPKKIE